MLFQMCYGPEIVSIYEHIRSRSGVTLDELCQSYQYRPDGDIRSLIEITLTFLSDLALIADREEQYVALGTGWDDLAFFSKLNQIGQEETPDSLNHVFARMFYQLFVVPDRMYIRNVHYHVNQQFEKTVVGQEKVNAWKRIMECFGLGYRAYSGFYALPQLRLMELFLNRSGQWEGPLQQYCEEHIDPILPCVYQGRIYSGILAGLNFLDKRGQIKLSRKQDLPYPSYGPDHGWNWIQVMEVSAR